MSKTSFNQNQEVDDQYHGFDLEDGREVSFEKSVWFSEFIHVQKGYDLLKTYPPTDEFLGEWEENEGYRGECERLIRALS